MKGWINQWTQEQIFFKIGDSMDEWMYEWIKERWKPNERKNNECRNR